MRRFWMVLPLVVSFLITPTAPGWSQMGPMGNPAIREFMEKQKEKGKEFTEAENKEGKEFMETLAGKPKAEKIAAIRAFKTTQYEKNCAFREKLVAERDEFIAKTWAAGNAPPQKMQERLKSRFAEQNAKIKEFFEKKHQENMAFLDKVLADATLDGAALDKAMSEFFQAQKASAEEFMTKLREEAQAQGQGRKGGMGMGGMGGRRRGN